jgi:hypothetical protein
LVSYAPKHLLAWTASWFLGGQSASTKFNQALTHAINSQPILKSSFIVSLEFNSQRRLK